MSITHVSPRPSPTRQLAFLLAGSTVALSAGLASGQQTQRISLPDGFPLFRSEGCDVTDDGRYVVYGSNSDNSMRDRMRIELYDRVSGTTTTVVSAPVNLLRKPSITGDGAMVAFESAESFVANDDNNKHDCYVVPSGGGAPVLVSARDGSPDLAGNLPSAQPRISDDGDKVAFLSYATTLTSDSLNGNLNIFVRTVSTNSTRLVSADEFGVAGNSLSLDPEISDDGRYVAFWSLADNLVPGDTNLAPDVFVKDLTNDGIVIVSRDDNGAISDSGSAYASLSSDGRYVAFVSFSSNMDGSVGGFGVVYRHDRDPDANGVFDEGNGVTKRISRDVAGNPPTETCYWPFLSDDGQRVLFAASSDFDHGVNQNRSGAIEVFLGDVVDGTQRNVHVDSDGNHVTDGLKFFGTHVLALAGDGSTAVFQTLAELDPNLTDSNQQVDVFAHDVAGDPSEYLGFDKEGSNGFFPELTVVGGLATGETADFRLRRAPASSLAFTFLSFASNPTPLFGGTIVPFPTIFPLLVPTDANGSFTATQAGGGGPFVVYLQFAIPDPGLPRPRWTISNALEVTVDP